MSKVVLAIQAAVKGARIQTFLTAIADFLKLEGIMANSTNNLVKSSKLGAVTQGR
ncbi:TPA: hypothetical protein I8303_003226 [Aeromonas hydrophila]|uniref:hypothetical protein n=1 Tax=Aeromonas hydrophila TaxID=644 RepID=UPI000AA3349B|nr:hypothetical protein [Aeromonas hydrophila]